MIGSYDLLAELGQGGMAEVFLAVVRGPGGFVKLRVIKRLKPDLALDQDFQMMFLDEARLAARLDHPNIVHTVEVQDDGGIPFIAMEYIEGESLNAIMRAARDRGGMAPLAIVLRILCDVLAGLHHAHEARDFDGTPLSIVHRDITPHNILVSYDGNVKVVDFGIAKARISAAQTASGVIKGKITYLSPEQAKGEPLDRRSDIFSIGVILYEALTGRRMWGDLVDYQILTRLATGDLPSVDEHARQMPQRLVEICRKAIALRPQDRFNSAAELQEALEAFLEESHTRVTRAEVGGVVVDLFREKRAAVRDIVERELKASETGIPSSGPLPQCGAPQSYRPPSIPPDRTGTTQRTAQDPSSGPRFGHGRTTTGVISTPDRLSTIPPQKKRLGMLGIAGTALLLVAASVVFISRNGPEPASATPPLSSAAKRIDVALDTLPPGATVLIDGRPVGSAPYRGQVNRDGSRHEIRAQAPGHRTKSIEVDYTSDIAMTLELPPIEADAASSPASASAPPPSDTGGRQPRVPAGKDQRPLDLDDPWK